MKVALAVFIILLILGIAGTAVFLTTLDANKYRNQVADALSKQTGRAVKFNGPVKLGFSWNGVTLDIQDAAIGNPFWTGRPMMAGIGRLNLGVALFPLFIRRIVITRLEVTNADIDLEIDRGGRRNWDMSPTESENKTATLDEDGRAKAESVSVHIRKISINGSQITLHDKEGKTHAFAVKNMGLGMDSAGVALRFTGEYNSIPLELNIDTGAHEMLAAEGSWPFDIDLAYASYKLKAEGNADMDGSQAAVSSYKITAGKSGIHGAFVVDWSGARPFVQGTLSSDHLDPADFKPDDKNSANVKGQGDDASADLKPVFSDTPLGLDALKSADADFDIAVDEFIVRRGELKQITAKLNLIDGELSLTPLKATFDGGEINGQVRINGAATPPQAAVALTGAQIKLEDLLDFLGAPTFLSGKADAMINLASSGDSMHALAGNAVGVANVVAAAGNVSSSAASAIAGGLMDLFAPGGSNNLNCLAVRFIVKDGIAHDNGILADTTTTTVAGNGGFDLGRETIDITLHAKSKQVNVGGLVPPLRVSGTFADPNFKIDPSETIQKVAGVLNGGSLGSNVPEIITEQGQNACLYTLDHPSSATTSKTFIPGTLMGKVNSGLNNINDVLKGFVGQ